MSDDPYLPPKVNLESPPAGDTAPAISINCLSCGGVIYLGDSGCSGCRTPVSKDDQRVLRERWAASSRDVARAVESSYWGRAAIALAAGLSLSQAAFLAFAGRDAAAAWHFAPALLLLGSFVFSLRAPLPAGVIALVVFCLGWMVQIVATPTDAFSGLLLRITILLALVGGISAEMNIRRRKRGLAARKERG
jgi:hypothetical protein